MMYVSDYDWDEFLLEVREQTKTVDASALGIKNWWWMFETMQDIERIFRQVQRILMNEHKSSGCILDSVKDDLQGYSNFRKYVEAEVNT